MRPLLQSAQHVLPRGCRRFGYVLTVVGMSDPLPCPPRAPAPLKLLHTGDALPLQPFSIGQWSPALCPSPASLNSVFALYGSHGLGTLNFLCDAWACASVLGVGEHWDLDLFCCHALQAEECAELHQHALALRAPLLRLLAEPELAVVPRSDYGHRFTSRAMQARCMGGASELWEKLNCSSSSACNRQRALSALEELTRTLAAASAGKDGLLLVDYDP